MEDVPRADIPRDDLYARLEVPPDAASRPSRSPGGRSSSVTIRNAGPDTLELAKRINVAHDWLGNPALRARYDLGGGCRRSPAPRLLGARRHRPTVAVRARGLSHGRPFPPRPGPAETLRRFLDRVARLSRGQLDRLSVAETTSIAFVASIRRFLVARRLAALDAVEAELRRRLPPRRGSPHGPRCDPRRGPRDRARAFLDDHLTEPFRERARDRLLRGWEAAVDQPRYGPNTRLVGRFLTRVKTLGDDELRALAGSIAGRIPSDPWPRGIDPEEDEALRVSSALAGRDAIARAAPTLDGLERTTASRATRLLRRTAHALVLRHAFTAADFGELIRPWQRATNDPGTGWRDEEQAEATVRRR